MDASIHQRLFLYWGVSFTKIFFHLIVGWLVSFCLVKPQNYYRWRLILRKIVLGYITKGKKIQRSSKGKINNDRWRNLSNLIKANRPYRISWSRTNKGEQWNYCPWCETPQISQPKRFSSQKSLQTTGIIAYKGFTLTLYRRKNIWELCKIYWGMF